VYFLRRVEQREEAVAPPSTEPIRDAGDDVEVEKVGGDEEDGGPEVEVVPQTQAEGFLYDPRTVHGLLKQRAQMTLLTAVLHERKAAFNTKVAALKTRKQADTDKLMDLKERVVEITDELGTHETEEGLSVPAMHPRETKGFVLIVADDEVPCDKYVSPEAVAAAVAAAAEAEAMKSGSGGTCDSELESRVNAHSQHESSWDCE
jgi:hypothetical protein